MTELYALTTTAKENLLNQIDTKTSEIRANYPSKDELENFQTSEVVTITITQEDIDELLSNDSDYTETTVFNNDTVAIVLGPQYETLTLPDSIKYIFFGDQQHTIKSEQFLNRKNLKRVFGKNITTIQSKAFHGSGLETFYVSHDTSTMFILEDQAFRNCQDLYSVDLDVALTYIPHDCFSGCTSLRSFKIYHPELLKKLYSGCFASCTNLEYIIGLDDVELNAIDSNCFNQSGLVYIAINGPTIQYGRSGNDHLVYQNRSLVELKINVQTLGTMSILNAPVLQYFRLGPNSQSLHERVLNDIISSDLIWIDCDYPDLVNDSDYENPDWTYFESLRMVTYRNPEFTCLAPYSIRGNNNMTFFEIPEHVLFVHNNAIYSSNTIETLVIHNGVGLDYDSTPFGIIKKRILVVMDDPEDTELFDELSQLYYNKVEKIYP